MADRNGYIGRAPSDSSVTVARQTFSPTGVTTDFTFASGYVPGYFDIFINGVKMIEGSDYTSTDGSTFSVLSGGATNGDVIEAVAYKAFNAASVNNAPCNFSVTGELSFGSVAAGSSVSFATTAFNLDGTPDITVRNFTGVAGTFSGFVAFSTSISVGGTITYEDVENIDSVGIVTARTGLKVLAGGANIVGATTATSFVKSGGTASEFLKADGSVDSSTYITAIGISSAGTSIGNATTLNFIGVGNTFAVNGNTIDVSIQGSAGGSGSGGGALDITSCLFI